MASSFQKRTITLIERETGMSMDDIRRLPIEECDRRVEAKLGHALKLGVEPGHEPRGNVLVQMGRILWPGQLRQK